MSREYTNSGSLGKNQRKEKDTHPDHTGNANVICPHCGVPADHWISAWVKEKEGRKFFSLAFKPKDQKLEDLGAAKHARIEIDDDIPF